MTVETYFPRGGRKPPPNTTPRDTKRDYDLFGKKRQKLIKHPRKTNIIQSEEDAPETGIQLVEPLSGKTIQVGMVILGCVREIQKVALDISLPGRLWGKVLINNISIPYTKLLQTVVDQNQTEVYKPLNELFSIGQCVAVKVLSLSDDKFGTTLSMMPQQINANISHTNISTGMTVWGAISEVEDHGYVVDLGINSCRAFLKKENCDAKKNYVVGELLWLAVTKADVSSTATTVSVNAQRKKIQTMTLMKDVSLDHLLPGMQVEFKLSQVLTNGIEGKFLNDYTGYIDVGQLKKYLYCKDEYKIDKIFDARITYMMSLTKIVHFTLKSLEPRKTEETKIGAIKQCKVQGVTPFGIYMRLKNSRSKGFVPLHRIQSSMPENTNLNYFRYFKRKYPKQSIVKCRILSYDYFEQMYICSLEKELLDENYVFTLDNLTPGTIVTAVIEDIQPKGLLVKIDQVHGFIKNEHMFDSVLDNYNSVKSRLKVGQKILARVWVINLSKNVLYLTMRPSLLKTNPIMESYEDAKTKKRFLGVIVKIADTGLLVQFFGDIHGWVPIKPSEVKSDPNSLFKIGQLVKCTVVYCKNQRLTLSLLSSAEVSEDSKPELNLGEHVDVIITHKTNEGFHVMVKDTDITAYVPVSNLSKFLNLATVFARIYQQGDEISDLVCVSKNDFLPTLSLRSREVNEDNIKDIESLEKGTVLPCNVATRDMHGINLEAPIKYFKNNVFVPSENISEDKVTNSEIKINQFIYAKVLDVANNWRSVTASTKLSDIWDFDIQSGVQYFSEYLNEILQIRNHFKSKTDPLACLDLGEVVSGVVSSVSEDKSCVVLLQNGARAFVQPEHTNENVSVGDKVEGVVLFWDFGNNYADMALSPKLISRINHIQNGKINIPPGVTNKSNSHAEIILVKEDFVLGVLRGAAGKRQLVLFPTKLHPNDLKPNLKDYVIGDYFNIQVNKVENGFIICLLKQLVKDLNYKWRRNLKLKNKLDHKNVKIEEKQVKEENCSNTVDNNNKQIKIDDIVIKEEPLSDDESENQIASVVGEEEIKREKKTSLSTDDEDNNKTNNQKRERKNSFASNEDSMENKKKRKKKSIISTDEEIVKHDKQTEKRSKNVIIPTNAENVKAAKKNKKERKKKISISTTEETPEDNIPTEKKKIKKSKISKDIDTVEDKKKNKNQDVEEDDLKRTKKVKKIKKISISEDDQQIEIFSGKKKKTKRKDDGASQNVKNVKKSKVEPLENVPAVLPGADNFWNISGEQENNEESSDDDEQDQKEMEKLQKKKKLTPAEKAEIARLEEERIRKIELELADAETAPKTADQFDRLVLANPNNSMFWVNYMAFHLQATEIEKARAIARKALSTIVFREEQERLNVWIAFLNLENRYGTQESFTNVLTEAVKMNDALSVYLQALNILADSKKTTEFLDLIKTVSRKFKQDFKMWVEAAEACYKCDLKEEARNLMQKSLKSLEEKQHVNLLVRFAFMESRYNEQERAEALLEKILASYPRRVDVWTSYVDMLIKNNRFHIARSVLERAICQKLPARKMKTLFSKFIQFETKYGDEESVKKVRKLATDYVKTALN